MERRPRSASRGIQANPVLRAAAMPTMVAEIDPQWMGNNMIATSDSGVTYASAKTGTQSYSAGTLTKR